MSQQTHSEKKSAKGVIYPILFGFFIMGFVDVVGIATNYVKADFSLSDKLANLIPMMVFIWFFLFSIPTGILMGRIGKRNTVALGLALTAGAMLVPLFWYEFTFVLVAFGLLGIGNTILQVALNPMIAGVVRKERMTSVLTLGQFIKAISSFLGPIIAAVAASWFGDWKMIFLAYSVTSVIATIWLLGVVPVKEEAEPEDRATFGSTVTLFADRYITMLFVGILFIVGVDVGLNTSIPKLLMDKTSMDLHEAGFGTSLYFAARTIGTFLGAVILAKYAAGKFLRYSIVLGTVAFVGLLTVSNPIALFVLIAIVGLACANVFSIIFSFALQHQPNRSNEISALMIMGVSGGALVTPIMGIVADGFGQAAGLSVLLVCLIYLAIVSLRIDKK